MARVGVILSKSEGGVGMTPAVTTGGNVGFMMNMSPENVNYSQYGAGAEGGSAAKEAAARRFGNMGAKARIGLGALGAFNAMYNATSSGQPGAIAAAGQGAMSGYYGSQGLEGWAAKQGAARQEKKDNRPPRSGPVGVQVGDRGKRMQQERMANYEQGAAAPHTSAGGVGMAKDHPFGEYKPVPEASFDASMFSEKNMQPPRPAPSPALQRRIDHKRAERAARKPQMSVAEANATLASGKSPSHAQGYAGTTRADMRLFDAPKQAPPADPTANSDSLGGLGDAMEAEGFTGEMPPAPNMTQTTLGQYTGQPDKSKQVAVMDANKLKEMENQGVDDEGNTISGKTKVQGG